MPIAIEEQVVWLDISMSKAERMQRINGKSGLRAIKLDLCLGEHVALDEHCAGTRIAREWHECQST